MVEYQRRSSVCHSSLDIKVVLVGDSTVGKTSIVTVANTDEFRPDLTPTISACFHVNTYMFDNTIVKLNIWDTAGQERYRALAPSFFRDMHIGLIVYSIDNRASFESVRDWYNLIEQHKQGAIRLFLVGNKLDLDNQRTVSRQEGIELAQELGAEFVEVSAKDYHLEIADLFTGMALTASKSHRTLEMATLGADISVTPIDLQENSSCC